MKNISVEELKTYKLENDKIYFVKTKGNEVTDKFSKVEYSQGIFIFDSKLKINESDIEMATESTFLDYNIF